jgi:Fe2+ transport system protein FeoA
MSIYDLNIGDKATILSINASKELKLRFLSFGITKGVDLEVREFAWGKANVELEIDNTLIALRVNEMKMIEVSRD